MFKISGSGFSINLRCIASLKPLCGRVDRASDTEMEDSGSIPRRVKPKTIKTGIHSFPALCSALIGAVWNLYRVWYTDGQVAAGLEYNKVPRLPPGGGNLVNKNVITVQLNLLQFHDNLPFKVWCYFNL